MAESTIKGSLQPYSGVSVSAFPEELKNKQKWELYTYEELGLYTSDSPSQVYEPVSGVWLDVIANEPWTRGLSHNCYVLCELDS